MDKMRFPSVNRGSASGEVMLSETPFSDWKELELSFVAFSNNLQWILCLVSALGLISIFLTSDSPFSETEKCSLKKYSPMR